MDDLLYPLYNSTYTIYRLSPLYTGNSQLLSPIACNLHARRLRDVLRGETFRGVDVGLSNADSSLSTSGSLLECTWELLGNEQQWRAARKERGDEGDATSDTSELSGELDAGSARGIHVQLHYERHTHSALLLQDPETASRIPGFTPLPLLLVRMPAALRETFINHLATTFDTRISPMRLRGDFLTSSLEQLLGDLTSQGMVPSDLQGIVKAVQIQLCFPSVTTALRRMDITIAKEDIDGFVEQGKVILSALAGQDTSPQHPFHASLSAHLKAHLALSLEHPAVKTTKLACGPFALSSDGKIKLFQPPPGNSSLEAAMQGFYRALLKEAGGVPLFEKQDLPVGKGKRPADALGSALPLEEEAKRKKFRNERRMRTEEERESEQIPVDPPPPYQEVDPATRT